MGPFPTSAFERLGIEKTDPRAGASELNRKSLLSRLRLVAKTAHVLGFCWASVIVKFCADVLCPEGVSIWSSRIRLINVS